MTHKKTSKSRQRTAPSKKLPTFLVTGLVVIGCVVVGVVVYICWGILNLFSDMSPSLGAYTPSTKKQFIDLDAQDIVRLGSKAAADVDVKVEEAKIKSTELIAASNQNVCYSDSTYQGFVTSSKRKVCVYRTIVELGAFGTMHDLSQELYDTLTLSGWQINTDPASWQNDYPQASCYVVYSARMKNADPRSSEGPSIELFVGDPKSYGKGLCDGVNQNKLSAESGAIFSTNTVFDESQAKSQALNKNYSTIVRIGIADEYYSKVYWRR